MLKVLNGPLPEKLVMETARSVAEFTDPCAKLHHLQERTAWLQAHWADLVHNASGKYVAVAGEQVFYADTALEAETLALRTNQAGSPVFVCVIQPQSEPRQSCE